jgi:hypothetical protein
VTSVNGVGDDDTCGTEGADGSFTIVDHDGNTVTVDVTAATQFFGKHHWDDDDAETSFADVCVGQKAGARGEQTDAIVAADMVFVLGHHRGDWHHRGDFRRHEGDEDDCEGRRHGKWKDHDGRDASFASHRGDDDDHGHRDGRRHGDWDDDDHHGDWGHEDHHDD